MQLLSFGRLLLFLPFFFTFFSFAQNTGAGSTVAGLTGGGFDPLALVIGQVGDGLGEGQQHLALDRPVLGPGAACPAAGLPGTGDEPGGQEPAG